MSARVHVPEEDRNFFYTKPILSRHNLHTLPYFSDSALVDLLDNIPRSHLRVWAPIDDPKHFSGLTYMYVDTTGIRGSDIYDCVLRGTFWINLQRVDKFDERFKNLSDQLYHNLSEQCPHFQVHYIHSYLLLSSPNMYFNLHVDSYENMFWCIRGGKTFGLYPPDDRRIVTQEFMEDICAGAREDFLPGNKKENEYLRKEYQISPGDMLSWPHHSPHEFVNNAQFNVGLGTFHGTTDGYKRVLNYRSSQYFRENWSFLRSKVKHGTLTTMLRRNLYRGIQRLGYLSAPKKIEFWTSYRLDPELPKCMSKVKNGPILVECSRLAKYQ